MDCGLNHSLLHQLHRASQLSDELFNTEADDHKITPRQYAVLAAVAAKRDLSQTALVNLTGIDRSTMTELVRRMVHTGLLSRKRTKSDARVYSVTITEQGQETLQRAAESACRAEQALLAKLGPNHGNALKASLTQLLSEPT